MAGRGGAGGWHHGGHQHHPCARAYVLVRMYVRTYVRTYARAHVLTVQQVARPEAAKTTQTRCSKQEATSWTNPSGGTYVRTYVRTCVTKDLRMHECAQPGADVRTGHVRTYVRTVLTYVRMYRRELRDLRRSCKLNANASASRNESASATQQARDYKLDASTRRYVRVYLRTFVRSCVRACVPTYAREGGARDTKRRTFVQASFRHRAS